MGTGERRRLIVLCSVAGFLAVVLLAKLVLFGGGGGSGSTAQATLPSSPITGAATGATPTTAAASRSTNSPVTFDVFATKNPFEPVIIVTPPDDTTPTTPTSGDGTTPTSGGTGTSTPTTEPPSNEPGPGTSVALLDVTQGPDGTPTARVQVSSTVYLVGEGDVFATSYRVVSLDDSCGQFLFGDAPFKLCEGEEVIK